MPRVVGGVLLVGLWACGGGGGAGGTGPSGGIPNDDLPAQPVPVSPVGGNQVATDRPTFTVRNARGFDSGQANYTFEVLTQGRGRIVASVIVPAGRSTTAAAPAGPLPRGIDLVWRATARGSGGETASTLASFRLPAVDCARIGDGYARRVIDAVLPFCAHSPNIYNDPSEVLGPPNARGFGPVNYEGFLSLGDGGHVTVDMEACATDGTGFDLRVYQAVGSEPVTVYAAGTPSGPFVLLESRKRCGERVPGSQAIRYCEFDLADAEVREARYFRIEDGELFPCDMAETPSEGADIDAVQILNPRP